MYNALFKGMVEAVELTKLNDEAIRDGLLLPNGLSLRKDYSCKLGKPLSSQEYRFYRYICESGVTGCVSVDTFKNSFYLQDEKLSQYNEGIIFKTVSRIRDKLGRSAIIYKPGLGYLSSRVSIELSVPVQNRTEI